MNKPQSLALAPILATDPRFSRLGQLAEQRFSHLDPAVLLVYLIDMTEKSALSWLATQFSLTGDNGWDLAESETAKRGLLKSAIELFRYKGTPWSIRQVIRNLGFGEVDLIEGTGRPGYDGKRSYNGLFVHGDVQAWAVYRVILKQPVTNDQAALLRRALSAFAPARCHLASLEYQAVAVRYNNSVNYDGSYNHGSS